MSDIFRSELAMLLITIGTFALGKYLFRRTQLAICNPLLIATIIIVSILLFMDIDYDHYHKSTRLIHFFLAPTVVALGYVLYEQVEAIRSNLLSIVISISVGSLITMASIVLICRILGSDNSIIVSLLPKSVTIPIALSLSGKAGGVASLTAVSVVITGIFGNMVGVSILRLMGISSKIAKGLAFGASSHAIGTAKAIECGALEGAMSGLAIGVTGVITALMMPLFELLLSIL
ncbi:MAG: LrgB family protein [Bacteroidales bacterium]